LCLCLYLVVDLGIKKFGLLDSFKCQIQIVTLVTLPPESPKANLVARSLFSKVSISGIGSSIVHGECGIIVGLDSELRRRILMLAEVRR